MQDITATQMLKFLHDQNIYLADKRVLLAVSGGIDSVVMMHIFHNSGINAGVAHCNFGLRGTESDGDEQFLRTLTQQLNFPFFTKKFDTDAYAQEMGISTQMAARDLRYSWFNQILDQEKYDYVAVAHHAGDNIETILLNLTRGTGLAGLRGMLPLNGRVLRPMMFLDRDTIHQYTVQNHIKWREDSSNQSDYYSRNQIRHHVLPVLKKINPSLEQTFKATSERLIAADNLVNLHFSKWKKEAVTHHTDHISIDIAKLTESSEPTLVLSDFLQNYGYNYFQAKEIVNSLSANSGKIFFSNDYQIVKNRSTLLLSRKNITINESVITSSTERFSFYDKEFNIKKSIPGENYKFTPQIALIDAQKLIFPLKMRSWEQGDRFFPLGMNGKNKKISDVFTDAKIAITEKPKIGILVNGNGDIIWIAGIRLDERFAISEQTKNIIEIAMVAKM